MKCLAILLALVICAHNQLLVADAKVMPEADQQANDMDPNPEDMGAELVGAVESSLKTGFGQCLHGDNILQTHDGGKTVKELHVGDEVLTVDTDGKLVYERVTLDAHRDPNKPNVHFIQIRAAGSGRSVTLTDKHLLYVGNELVPADAVRVGDEVTVVDEVSGGVSRDVVSNVTRAVDEGVYNPLVGSGRILVGGVLTSVYPQLPGLEPPVMHVYGMVIKLLVDNILPSALYDIHTRDDVQQYILRAETALLALVNNLSN